jgi:hypothetical protein
MERMTTKRDRITTEGQAYRTNRLDRSPDGCLVCIKAQRKHQLWPGKRPPDVLRPQYTINLTSFVLYCKIRIIELFSAKTKTD